MHLQRWHLLLTIFVIVRGFFYLIDILAGLNSFPLADLLAYPVNLRSTLLYRRYSRYIGGSWPYPRAYFHSSYFLSLNCPNWLRTETNLNSIQSLNSTCHNNTFSLQYIFEGLGPLISNIVTSWPTHIRRLNENGIKKMCRNILSLQQQLTNITMARELSLDRARQYYEIFYLTPQVRRNC